ncbi:FAD-binding oxidoreductase [Yimella sp. cx-51]|uniref:FAD-binding oxidoreductase n=1 Tax=Yimella sp. cx-51 TaxID=2770551 RepID=UPI00165EACA0|nr:FAD-binding oxidoreductase [Yimella sp. cx-51]MBC9956883.1 FAD-binding oxidoreductase [Yimella sp. cx-51]QTH39108.1 FAD-binding oxidoreductase [Yimella sp. cx-51]
MQLLDALHDHEIDAAAMSDTFDGADVAVTVRPTTTQEVSTALRLAHERGASVLVCGHGTKQTWGGPAGTTDVLLDMSTMDQVLEHQPGDLIVSAQAGCPLADVQQLCGQAKQRLALDEMVPGSTVGGAIATNPSGPLRVLAGTMRDLLIGITLVLADGTIAHAGGKVVKNVAGYDLGKLLVGSYGTLAVVTEATFRLHPVPAAFRWVTADVPLDRLSEVLAAALHTQDAPSAIEIRCESTESAQLALLLEGTEEGVAARAARVATDLGGAEGDEPAWARTHPWTVGEQTGLKITAQLSAVPAVARTAAQMGWIVQGSAGAGVLYAARESASAADVSAALDSLRRAARGGSVIVLDAPRQIRETVDIWGPIPAVAVMQQVKDQFDPSHSLAAGRFVGGI